MNLAGVDAARASVAAADVAVATARSQVIQAEASIEVARSRIERLQVEIDDCTRLATRSRAPRDVQRLAFQKAIAVAKGFPGAQVSVPQWCFQHVDTGILNLHVAARKLDLTIDEAVLERLRRKPASTSPRTPEPSSRRTR